MQGFPGILHKKAIVNGRNVNENIKYNFVFDPAEEKTRSRITAKFGGPLEL
jgi:hypothetical protein